MTVKTETSLEKRKKQILQAASDLFSEKGFSGIGLREIGQHAGVSLGNIYNHFKNKEEIFTSIFDPSEIARSLSRSFELISQDFPNNLDQLILSIKRAVDENSALYTLTFIDLIEFGGINTDRMLRYFKDFGESFFRDRLEEKARNGEIRNIDVEFYSRYFMVALISFFASSRMLPSLHVKEYSDEEIASMLSNVMLNGLRR